ncbi:MAG TPA: alpha-ketoglutarate-dependent dioxygenase AlkB [Bacteroidales bacterium]|nr:alpha-ketoglutarate-dependent dioxygenase AlkB [Bacteroidales bacterium]
MQQILFAIPPGINILPYEGEALFYPDFLSEPESLFYYRRLLGEYEFRQVPVKINNKYVLQPKLTALAGEEDQLNPGSELPVQSWTETLFGLKTKVEETAEIRFTHALLNLYRDGKDGVGWHRDREEQWGAEPVIASLSLGTARLFQMRNTINRQIIRNIELTPGSLLIMKGLSQKNWEHRIPKTSKRIGPRLNITFRIKI